MLLLEDIISMQACEPESSAIVPKSEVLSPLLPHRSHLDDAVVDNQTLTKLPSTHRPNRLPKLPPHTAPGHLSLYTAAISPSLNNNNHNIYQDVHSKPLSSVSSLSRSPPVPKHVSTSTPIESPLQTFPSSLPHGPINSPSSSLRTPVFHNHEQLVAFCQLPTQLPPPPRLQRSVPDPLAQFQQLKNNYLKMLSKTPTDTTTDVVTTMPSPEDDSVLMPPPPAAEQASQLSYRDVLESPFTDFFPSPEFTSPEFLTSPNFMMSPLDDSPFPEYLTTPMLTEAEYLDTSPIISTDDFPDFGFGGSLFPEFAGWPQVPAEAAPVPGEVKKTQDEVKEQQSTPQLDDLYTISPDTADASTFGSTSPAAESMPSSRRSVAPKPSSSRRKAGPTGTRKNITPEGLIPIDAPIQTRNYQTPSTTSRKDVPAVFLRKRVRSQAFEEEEEEELADLPPNATEKEQIEHKRRQNTLAARKSRKRKLEHQLYLEEKVEDQEREIERWRTRAITYQKMLVQHGVSVPAFDD